MNFELTLWRACVADANPGRIRTDFIIERQGGDGDSDARTARQVDPAIDPARIHDIDSERSIRRARAARSVAAIGRFQQQPDGIATELEIVTVAAQRRRQIEALRPSARNLVAADEGRSEEHTSELQS